MSVAFRSAKVRHFRGAKGDQGKVIHRTTVDATKKPSRDVSIGEGFGCD